jgi:hypothetical protein
VAKKATAPVVETAVEDTDDDIEELDEVEATAEASEGEAPAKKGKAKKAKPERVGLTSKEAAARLSEILGTTITPVRLRRILRSEDGGHADKEYTRYDLTEDEIQNLANVIRAGAAAKAAAPKKSKAAASTEDAAEEVEGELADLEDTEDSDSEEELDLDLEDDEDEEEEEE